MLIRHSIIYLLGKLLPALLGLASVGLYSRLLDSSSYGQFSMLLSAAGMLYVLFYGWLWLGLGRFIPQFHNREAVLRAVILRSFILLSLVVALAGGILMMVWPDKLTRPLVLLIIPLCWLMGWYEINLELLRARLQSGKYTIISLLRGVATILLSSIMAYWGFGAQGMIWGAIIGIFFSVITISHQGWKCAFNIPFEQKILTKIGYYGLPLMVSYMLVMVIFGSDRILLGFMLDSGAAGHYSIVNDLALKSLHTLTVAIDLAAFPLIVRAVEASDLQAARLQLLSNCTFLVAILIPATTGLIVLSNSIINLFLDEAYRDPAKVIFPWIIVATFFAGINQAFFQHAFTLGNNTKLFVKIASIACIVNISTNILFIPIFGIVGSAYASLIGFATLLLLSWHYGKYVFNLPIPWRDVFKIIFASITMGFLLSTLNTSGNFLGLTIDITLGFFVYILMIITLNPDNYREKFFKFLSAKFQGKIL